MPKKTLPRGVEIATLRDVCRATAEYAAHKHQATAAMTDGQLLSHYAQLVEAAVVCYVERAKTAKRCPEPSPN